MASDWYRDEDLLVARDATGRLVGHHWTKLTTSQGETRGEVYVLGVDPSYVGRGAGRALPGAGIGEMYYKGHPHRPTWSNPASASWPCTAPHGLRGHPHTDVA